MKLRLLLILVLYSAICSFIIYGCKKISHNSQPVPILKRYDTITSLAFYNYDTAIWVHDSKITMVTHANEQTVYSCSEAFTGSLRSQPKTSYSSSPYEAFNSINNLRATLPTDSYMQNLGLTSTSPRVTNENRNCSISNSYLLAIAREADNDFHMIISDSAHIAGNLLNCEASGDPNINQASYAAINTVRIYLKGYFGTDFCGHNGYTKFSPALHIVVLKGSLFFDYDHLAGTVGPYGLQPNTSWEMHPVHDIGF